MLREGARLSRTHQRVTFTAFAILFATGALWLLFEHFVRVPGDFGNVPHPLQVWWLRLHGAAASMFLLVLGSLVRGHIRIGWRTRQNRLSGSSIVSANVVLILTGWGLYYIGIDTWRAAASAAHWVVGLVAGPFLIVHVRAGRQTRRRRHRRHSQ